MISYSYYDAKEFEKNTYVVRYSSTKTKIDEAPSAERANIEPMFTSELHYKLYEKLNMPLENLRVKMPVIFFDVERNSILYYTVKNTKADEVVKSTSLDLLRGHIIINGLYIRDRRFDRCFTDTPMTQLVNAVFNLHSI